jgi:hypothetical protein
MSGGGWKEPFYKVAKQDSRNLAWLGNAIGWQGLEDAAKYNVKNPGHAVSTAAEYALGGYLGGLLGAGGEAAGAAGEAAVPAFEGAVASGAATTTEELAAQQAAQQALQQGGAGILGGAPVTDLSTMGNTVPVKDLSTQAGLLDKSRLALSSGSSSGKSGLLAQQLGMKMLQPQGQQQPMPAPRPQGGSMEPLRSPYGQPYGTSSGNSLGLLTEEQKKKLRAQGYQI